MQISNFRCKKAQNCIKLSARRSASVLIIVVVEPSDENRESKTIKARRADIESFMKTAAVIDVLNGRWPSSN
jgi:hypothetical protein